MKRKLFFSIVFLMIISLETLTAQPYNVQAYSGTTLYAVPMFTATGTTPQIANSVFYQNSGGTIVGATNLLKIESVSPYGNFLGYQAGNSNTGTSNVGLGYQALYTNTSGQKNTATGVLSLKSNSTGQYNTANGYGALNASTASENTAVGWAALLVNTSGANNTAIGSGILYNSTTGDNNTATGYRALFSNVAGSNATAIGYSAMYYTNSTATAFTNFNVAVGYEALRGSTTASNNTGNYNMAIGYQSLWSNTTGSYNTANGYQALYSNTSGILNNAFGDSSLYNNTTACRNTAIGNNALYTQSYSNGGTVWDGDNVAIGFKALYLNQPTATTNGKQNTAIGVFALYNNTTGSKNTSIGYDAGSAFTTGGSNTGMGYNTLKNVTTGSSNTGLGYSANTNGDYSNASALGSGATATTSNYIKVGDANVTVIAGQVNWTAISDGRFKFNIQENVKGLEFIKKLRPVTYQMNTHQFDNFVIQNMPESDKILHQAGMDFAPATAIIHSGFIAQEVDTAALACGFISSIVHTPVNSTDPYALSYAEIVVPLVKAVQEQQRMIDSLKIHQKITDSLLVVLQNSQPQGTLNKYYGSQSQSNPETTLRVDLDNGSQPILYQNEPNPFSENTIIRYFIPEDLTGNDFIVFYDMYGKELKKTDLSTKGFGKINVNTEKLSSGMYSYSLIINGNIVETKKMIRNK